MKQSLCFYYLAFQLFSIVTCSLTAQKRDPVLTDKKAGYECGNFFFSDPYLKQSQEKYFRYLNRQFASPKPLEIPFQSPYTQYIHWPLKPDDTVQSSNLRRTSHCYLILNEKNIIVDVISRTFSNKFTKCIRVDDPASNSPNIQERPNGYECANSFFADRWIPKPLELARTGLQTQSKALEPYRGTLYPEQQNYVLWPIFNLDDLAKKKKNRPGEYYLFLDKSGKLIDLVVKGKKGNILRCKRTWKALPAPADDPKSKIFVPPPKSGFRCGRVFFYDDYVKEAASRAQLRFQTTDNKRAFPKEHIGKLCSGTCYEWPLKPNLDHYNHGPGGKYRLVTDFNFKIMTVIISEKNNIHICEKGTIEGSKKHNTNDFRCDQWTFKNNWAVKHVDIACEMRNTRRNIYPQIYNPEEASDGEGKLIYPISLENSIRSNHRYFVLMSDKCVLLGMLAKHHGFFTPCQEVNENGSRDRLLNS